METPPESPAPHGPDDATRSVAAGPERLAAPNPQGGRCGRIQGALRRGGGHGRPGALAPRSARQDDQTSREVDAVEKNSQVLLLEIFVDGSFRPHEMAV